MYPRLHLGHRVCRDAQENRAAVHRPILRMHAGPGMQIFHQRQYKCGLAKSLRLERTLAHGQRPRLVFLTLSGSAIGLRFRCLGGPSG